MSCTRTVKLFILLISKRGRLGERLRKLGRFLHLRLKSPSSEQKVSEAVQRGTGASARPGLAFGGL